MMWNALVRDTDSITPQWVGNEWLHKTDTMLRKTMHVRENIPAEQQIDIFYNDMNRDWQGVIRRIYTFIGMELTQQTLDAMQAWLDRNRQHKHGAHVYKLDDFGLTAAVVENKLSHYRDKYQIPLETIKS